MKKRIVSLLVLIAMVFTMTVIGTTAAAADTTSAGLRLIPQLKNHITLPEIIADMPLTFDAVVSLPTTYADRAGSISGSYVTTSEPFFNFDVYSNGQPRLMVYDANIAQHNFHFSEVDIRSDAEPVRVTISMNPAEKTVTCYINGEAKQTLDIPDTYTPGALPQVIAVGSDNRAGNDQFFKGQLFSFSMHSESLTADEVASGSDKGLIAKYDFTDAANASKDLSGNGNDLVGELLIADPDAPAVLRLIPQLKNHITLPEIIADMPLTFDAVVSLPTTYADRAGSISGSYVTTSEPFFNFDVYSNGQPRLMVYDANIAQHNFHFTEVDIRSDADPVRVTVSMDLAAKTITCYINGEAKQTLAIPDTYVPGTLPQLIAVGSDNRAGNDQFFKGTMFSFSMHSEALTADEIAAGSDKALVAKYDFTDKDNANKDLSGNGNDIVGTLLIDDPNALFKAEPEFTEGLTFEDPAILYQTDYDGYSDVPYTYAAWIYLPKSVDGRGGVIIGNYQSGSIPCVSIEISTVGVPRFYHIDLNNTVTDLKFMDADVRISDWAHVAFTVSDVVACYVNGELVGEQPMGEFEPLATEMSIGIGGDLRPGNAQNFKGRIREIVLFEDALSAADISTLYKSGVAAVGKDLVAHYDLTNAKVGETINDISGNDYHAFDPYAVEETEAPETEAPVETAAPETEAPETEAPETTAPETEAPVETEAPETAAPETEAPETEAPAAADEEKGGSAGIIIGVVAAVVVIGAAAGVVIAKKKKN